MVLLPAPVKILIATFSFPPQTGGVAAVAQVQATGWAARGHDVTVACEFDPARPANFSLGPVRVRQFKIGGSFEAGRGYHGEVAEYQHFIANEPADIILCHCPQMWPTDLAAEVFSKTPARKILLSHGVDAHLWRRHGKFPWGLGQWLRSLPYAWRLPGLLRRFDQVVFLSGRRDFGRFFDVRLAHWCGLRNWTIIPNGIHLDDLRGGAGDFRERFGIPPGQRLLLNVANYGERKNQLATLRSFLRARRKDATLAFIGGEHNEYSRRMEELLHRSGDAAGPVLILEKVPKDWINAAYRTADLFVLNATAETQPLVILDAMGAGVPFICSDVGCVTDFPGGLIVRNEAQTVAAIHRLLDDPELCRQLGAAGRAEAGRLYSWDKVLTAYERLFEKLLLKPSATSGGNAR